MQNIYLDHAATTPVDPRVLEAMLPYFGQTFGNPNSLHAFGRRSVRAVDEARDEIAALLGARPHEIYFTSGGTEADNWALRGAAHANVSRGRHVLVSAVEHPAVAASAHILRGEGFAVDILPVDGKGRAEEAAAERMIRPDTTVVALMSANNEVGTLQPIERFSRLCADRGALLFTDAVQAAGALPLHVDAPPVQMLSLSAHKFYGPKGVGALYVRSGVRIDKLVAGGHQERGMRGGTTNVAGVVGLAAALRLARAEMEQNNAHVAALRDRFWEQVRALSGVRRNGDPQNSLPSVLNLSFAGVEGEALLYCLDREGIAVSSGSACSSGSPEPSPVLTAMGLDASLARADVRISFGKDNTAKEIDRAAAVVCAVVAKLRKAR